MAAIVATALGRLNVTSGSKSTIVLLRQLGGDMFAVGDSVSVTVVYGTDTHAATQTFATAHGEEIPASPSAVGGLFDLDGHDTSKGRLAVVIVTAAARSALALRPAAAKHAVVSVRAAGHSELGNITTTITVTSGGSTATSGPVDLDMFEP